MSKKVKYLEIFKDKFFLFQFRGWKKSEILTLKKVPCESFTTAFSKKVRNFKMFKEEFLFYREFFNSHFLDFDAPDFFLFLQIKIHLSNINTWPIASLSLENEVEINIFRATRLCQSIEQYKCKNVKNAFHLLYDTRTWKKKSWIVCCVCTYLKFKRG